MTTLRLNGRITAEEGLEVDLPPGLPPGEARITIEIPMESGSSSADLDQALKASLMTGAEIVRAGLMGGWSGISDGADWVEEKRRQRRVERSRR